MGWDFFQPSSDGACLMNLLLTQVCDGGPACPALTAGEAYDNRLAGKLLSRLKSGALIYGRGGSAGYPFVACKNVLAAFNARRSPSACTVCAPRSEEKDLAHSRSPARSTTCAPP